MIQLVVILGLCGPGEVAAFYRRYIREMNSRACTGEISFESSRSPRQTSGFSRAIHRRYYKRTREQASCSWRKRHQLKTRRNRR